MGSVYTTFSRDFYPLGFVRTGEERESCLTGTPTLWHLFLKVIMEKNPVDSR